MPVPPPGLTRTASLPAPSSKSDLPPNRGASSHLLCRPFPAPPAHRGGERTRERGWQLRPRLVERPHTGRRWARSPCRLAGCGASAGGRWGWDVPVLCSSHAHAQNPSFPQTLSLSRSAPAWMAVMPASPAVLHSPQAQGSGQGQASGVGASPHVSSGISPRHLPQEYLLQTPPQRVSLSEVPKTQVEGPALWHCGTTG